MESVGNKEDTNKGKSSKNDKKMNFSQNNEINLKNTEDIHQHDEITVTDDAFKSKNRKNRGQI